jgi:hypothetical protein
MGTSPELITLMIDYFHELDTDGSGSLSVKEATERCYSVTLALNLL